MSRQRRRDTAPEMAIRQLLHARGLRYRVAWRIPGMPRRSIDIAFTRAKVAVFVDGCFWHSCPVHRTMPASNRVWWETKLATNRQRDTATDQHLAGLGWRVLRIWEHEDPSIAADLVAEHVNAVPASSGDAPLNAGAPLRGRSGIHLR
jgi:DNA mismatch endonuclease (patch repair protein)